MSSDTDSSNDVRSDWTFSTSNITSPITSSRNDPYDSSSDEDNRGWECHSDEAEPEAVITPSDTGVEIKECERCNEPSSVVKWHCRGCKPLLCDKCWNEIPHHKNNMPGHEKMPYNEHQFYETVLDGQGIDRNALHMDDIPALWFAVDQADSGGNLDLEEYPRYSHIISEHRKNHPNLKELHPRLVSFVGTTGAGKSTLIRFLLQRPWKSGEHLNASHAAFSKPVSGDRNKTYPTSGNVHLYQDPYPDESEESRPLFFADCEGLDAGASLPYASWLRQKSELPNTGYQHLHRSVSYQINPSDSCNDVGTREQAIEKLFPRLLYNFSEVVVHVMPGQMQKTMRKNIELILQWAHASEGSATNRLSTPRLIVVINQAPERSEFDPQAARVKILKEQSSALEKKHGRIHEHAERFRRLGRRINTLEELLHCYYSRVEFIYIPNAEQGRNVHQLKSQLKTLHDMIEAASSEAQKEKEISKLLLPPKGQDMLFKLAFQHYTRNPDQPFDFIEQYFSLFPIVNTLSDNYLRLLRDVKDATQDTWRHDCYLEQVIPVLVSSAALDATRVYPDFPGSLADVLRGSTDLSSDDADNLNEKTANKSYLSHVHSAVQTFCDHFVRCEYQDERRSRCKNNRASHQEHQGEKGQLLKVIGRKDGDFSAAASFQSKFLDGLLSGLKSAIDSTVKGLEVALDQAAGSTRSQRMWRLHMERWHELAKSVARHSIWRELSICSHCLGGYSAEVLPCDHGICVSCMEDQALQSPTGTAPADPRARQIRQCLLHLQEEEFDPPYVAYLMPPLCGPRILTIGGGGVRGIVGLKMLLAIEERMARMGGRIPIQRFFDLIGGTSAGAFAAIGTGIKDLRVEDLIPLFEQCCKQGISSKTPAILQGMLSKVRFVPKKPHSMDKAIKTALGDIAEQRMIKSNLHVKSGQVARPKVFVTATVNYGDKGAIVPNYIRPRNDGASEYEFLAPNDPDQQLYLCEAARASTAAPIYFPPFLHPRAPKQELLYDGGLFFNNPAGVAYEESLRIWPGQQHHDDHPDILLSIGNGFRAEPPKEPKITFCETVNVVLALCNSLLRNMNSEKIWKDHFQHSPRSPLRYIRMNFKMDMDVEIDDKSKFRDLRDEASRYLATEAAQVRIDSIIHRLIATSFYLAPSKLETQDGTLHFIGTAPLTYVNKHYVEYANLIPAGKIKCRFLDHSTEIKQLGKIVWKRFSRNPIYFALSHPPELLQSWLVDPDARQKMREDGVFEIPVSFPLPQWVTRLDFVLASKYFKPEPISGFPLLVRDHPQADLLPLFAKLRV